MHSHGYELWAWPSDSALSPAPLLTLDINELQYLVRAVPGFCPSPRVLVTGLCPVSDQILAVSMPALICGFHPWRMES